MSFQAKLKLSIVTLALGITLVPNVWATKAGGSAAQEATSSTTKRVSPSHMPFEDQLFTELGEIFKRFGLDENLAKVDRSTRIGSDFQCNGLLKSAKDARIRDLFSPIKAAIETLDMVSTVTMSPQGHINISLTDEVLAARATYMLVDKRLGIPRKDSQRVLLDFGGPNIAKSMHVGHLRSSIIGDSLQRLFRFMGDEVTSDTHLGDWGLHIGMVIRGIQKLHPNHPCFQDGYDASIPCPSVVTMRDLEEIYPREANICKADKAERQVARDITSQLQAKHPGYTALWQHIVDVSVKDLKHNFETLGIRFDLWLGESSVNDRIPQMVARARQQGVCVDKEGAVLIPIQQATDKREVPPVVLVKANGGYTYQTTDLATIEERVERRPNLILYVVDKRQALHFFQVFRAARLLNILPPDVQCEHAGFGTMNGVDGTPFKTRAGGVLKLEDLLKMSMEKAASLIRERAASGSAGAVFDEEESAEIARCVGLSAVKYSDLSHQRESDYVFDLDKVISFQGDTGPYLLYTTVRIKSLLQKVGSVKTEEDGKEITGPLNSEERALILTLSSLGKALGSAYAERSPTPIASHVMDTAKTFNVFYRECPILDKGRLSSSRLALAILTLRNLSLMLELLGIEAPQRM